MKIYWAGWYKEGTHDKIWGILEVNDTHYNFWCRRGAKMQFKKTDDLKVSHKRNKGYNSITSNKLEEIYPGFFDEAQSNLVFAIMADKVR